MLAPPELVSPRGAPRMPRQLSDTRTPGSTLSYDSDIFPSMRGNSQRSTIPDGQIDQTAITK
eukprot:11214373-Lingulodinium_polyedra.AAC.1